MNKDSCEPGIAFCISLLGVIFIVLWLVLSNGTAPLGLSSDRGAL